MIRAAAQVRLQNRVTRLLETTLRVQMTRELRLVLAQATRSIDSDLGMTEVIEQHRERLKAILYSFYAKAFRVAGIKLRRELKAGLLLETKDEAFEIAATEFARRWSAKKVTEIADTTRERLNRAVRRGIEENLSNRELARELRRFVGTSRAVTIARTESHAAAQAGQLDVATASGVVKKKVWVSAEDDRTRPGHAEADGQEVDIDEPFIVDGEELMFPGDPSGSAGNVINCRCAVVYKVK